MTDNTMPDDDHERVRVTLLASVHPLVRERLVSAVRQSQPRTTVLRHELTTTAVDGLMHRVVQTATGERDLARSVDTTCCLSCQVRADIIAALTGFGAEEVLVVLPDEVRLAAVAARIAREPDLDLASIVVAVDPVRLESDLAGRHHRLPEDGSEQEGSVGPTLAGLLRLADVVVHETPTPRVATLLRVLAPGAVQWMFGECIDDLIGARHHDPERLHVRLLTGVAEPCPTVRADGVQAMAWRSRRPFHPDRLLQALDDGAFARALRVSGHVWVATRPDTVLDLDTTGRSVELGVAGVWLDALPDTIAIDPVRRDRTNELWDPYYGDRHHHLSLVIDDNVEHDLVEVLESCLVTDGELAEGPDGWRAWDDPFDLLLDDEHLLLAAERSRNRAG